MAEPTQSVADNELLDETYIRMRDTGPEFDGWLSNHGPMAADAMIRMGCGDQVDAWVDQYTRRLDEAPAPRWKIAADEWREVLGHPSRLADWIALFDWELREEESWRGVLIRWWPRLLNGAVAAATHPLIRTGHCVRALLEAPTEARRRELAQALGYWAARYQPLPAHRHPTGNSDPAAALAAITSLQSSGSISDRLDDLAHAPSWPATTGRLRATPTSEHVPAALDALVDAAVTHYAQWAHGEPIMLVHAATAPRAASLVLPALPEDLWIATYETAWAASAAIATIYRPSSPAPPANHSEQETNTPDRVTEHAIDTGDEHAIKFVEVAQESHRRGNPHALAAGARASHLIALDQAS